MALSGNAVAEASFDIERLLYPTSNTDVTDKQHIFVTGLARAGTTILMRQLYATGAFRTLTYRDMPFVLAPNLWSRMSRVSRKEMAPEERAHGDGLLVDFDSPEALEEIFWRVTCGDEYILEDRLVPMTADPAQQSAFKDYVALLLLQHEGKRYLSKNNNNILRLQSLTQCFPNAAVIIPLREPVQHAYSLLRQHRRFLSRHDEDAFSLSYMNWLVHHEFGRGHKRFVFDRAESVGSESGDPETELAYWLQLWLDTYAYVAKNAPESCIFLSYERLCDEVDDVWPRLCSRLRMPIQAPSEPLRRSHEAVDVEVPDELAQACGALYEMLREREAWR
jgi:hypothetical protein